MVELLQTQDLALISAVKAALAAQRIGCVEFDGPMADVYGGIFARRLMVLEEDLAAARAVLRDIAPEHVAPESPA